MGPQISPTPREGAPPTVEDVNLDVRIAKGGKDFGELVGDTVDRGRIETGTRDHT